MDEDSTGLNTFLNVVNYENLAIKWPKDASLPLFLLVGEMRSISSSPIFVVTYILLPQVTVIQPGPTCPFLPVPGEPNV